MSNINDFFHFADFWNFIWAHFCFRKNRAFRRSASYALHSRWSAPKSLHPASKLFLTIQKTAYPHPPGTPPARLQSLARSPHKSPVRSPSNPCPSPQTLPSSPIPPSAIPNPSVILNFAVIPNLIRDLYKIAPKCCTAPKTRLARTFVSGTILCKAAGNQFSDILHAIAMVYGCSGRQVLLHKKMCGEEGGKGGLA